MWIAVLETVTEKKQATWRRSFGAVDVKKKMDDPASARSLRDLLQTMAEEGVLVERASAQGKYLPIEEEAESSSTKDQKESSGPSTSTRSSSSGQRMSASDAALEMESDSWDGGGQKTIHEEHQDERQSLQDAISSLDLPGDGSTLEARRDAVRACYEYLRENRTAQRSEFIEDVYDDHPARFGSPGGWWNAIGKEGLRELARIRDDVAAPIEGGRIWAYEG